MNPGRQAPPVQVRGCGGPFWRVLGVGLPALTAASLGAWVALHLDWPGFWAAVLASKLAALTAAVLAWRRPQVHALAWDGQQWLVDERPARVQLMLDLGPWLLLRLRPLDGAPSRWLPLSASEAGADWGPLRAAVYARAPSARPASRLPEHPRI